MRNFWAELKRRRVIRVAIAYGVGAWVLLQVGDTILGLGNLPEWIGQALLILVIAGLPVALILAWIFDITPEGVVTTADDSEPEKNDGFHFSDPELIDATELSINHGTAQVMVGRSRERSLITQLMEQAKAGHGSVVLISGEPGVGKTRLGEEAIFQASHSGLIGLTGHAYEERSTPYITSSEILEEVVRVLPRDSLRNALGNTAPEIARLLPELRQSFPGIPQPADLPPEQQQRFLFKAVLEFLDRLSQSAPLVLLLDDLHWADESSILLLEHLAPRIQSLPILMVITYRDVEADMSDPFRRALTRLCRESYATVMNLDRFTEDDVAALLSAMGAPEPPRQVVEAIFSETNGNAFFVQSVYQHLAEEGKLFDDNGSWLSDLDAGALDVPDSVRLVTGQRISKLSKSTQEMLSMAAVMGLRFRLPVLESIMADPDATIDALEEAEAAQLIKPTAGGKDLRYEFVHALARQTLLDALSSPRQRRHHLKIANAIESSSPDARRQAAELAFHLNEAGNSVDSSKLILWANKAGDNAMSAAAFDEAEYYFRMAIEAIDQEQQELKADLLHKRGAAHLSQGEKGAFKADLQEAFEIYVGLGLGDQAARVASDVSYIYTWDAEPHVAFQLVSEALSLLGEEKTPGRALVLSARGLAFTMSSQPGSAEKSHNEAVALARKLNDPALLADTLQNQALGNWMRLGGRLLQEPAHEAAHYRRETNQEWNLGHCLWMEKAGLVFQGRFEEATAIDVELEPIAARNENFGAVGCSALMTSVIAQARGNLKASTEEQHRAIRAFEEGGFPWGVYSQGHLSVNELLLGNRDEARAAIDAAGDGRIHGIAWSGCETGYWLCGKATLGDPDVLEAFISLKEGLPGPGDAMSAGEVGLLEGSIEALILAGHDDLAADLYPTICSFIESDQGLLAFAYGIHERYAAMAATAANDWESAERHYEKTLALAEELPHRMDQPRIRYWYAKMLIKRGRPEDLERAGAMLADAHELGQKMNMNGLIAFIERLQENKTG